MHRLTAWGQWEVQLLQCTAPLSGGSGRCNSNSCNALPHCLGAVSSGTPAMHCPTAWGEWAVDLLQCTASLPCGSGQWTSCNALPHCPGGSGQCNPCNALPHCLGAVGSGTPAMHRLTAWGQWAVQLLQCTASLPWGQWAVELLQCTASLPGGSGQWNSCNALPHCLGAVDSATRAMHRLTALGQWALKLPQCIAALPGGAGQCNSCNALPHCLGAVGSAAQTPAMHCLTALGAVGSGTPAMHCPTAWGQGQGWKRRRIYTRTIYIRVPYRENTIQYASAGGATDWRQMRVPPQRMRLKTNKTRDFHVSAGCRHFGCTKILTVDPRHSALK